MTINEEEIRKLAYQIWEAEGKPEGQSDRHWKQATILAKSEYDAKEVGLKRLIDPSEVSCSTEPFQPDQT